MPPRLLSPRVLPARPTTEKVVAYAPSPVAVLIETGKLTPVVACHASEGPYGPVRVLNLRPGEYSFEQLDALAGVRVAKITVRGSGHSVNRASSSDTVNVTFSGPIFRVDDREVHAETVRRMAYEAIVQGLPPVIPTLAFNYNVEYRRIEAYLRDMCIMYIEE